VLFAAVIGVDHDFPAIITSSNGADAIAIPVIVKTLHHEIETVSPRTPTSYDSKGQIALVVFLAQTEIVLEMGIKGHVIIFGHDIPFGKIAVQRGFLTGGPLEKRGGVDAGDGNVRRYNAGL